MAGLPELDLSSHLDERLMGLKHSLILDMIPVHMYSAEITFLHLLDGQ